ncbi:MAG: hypothetical protein RMM30_02780 [Armatimonadota bacterium]|nr:hypothetical protein [Armatimonadota bacterium]MDW8155495.1 hypothetical protein [Armatimonadota bacterium]
MSPTQTALVTYLNRATAASWGWLLLGVPVGPNPSRGCRSSQAGWRW